MKRFALLLLLAVLLPTAVAASAPPQEMRVVLQVEQATRRIRGLSEIHPVKAVFADDNVFDSVVRLQVRKGNSDAELEIGQREDVLLGFLKKSQSLRRIVLSNLSKSVIGLYNPNSKTLYVRNHAGVALGVERHVIAHEYTHALQDQHYDLNKLLPDQTALPYRNSDMVSAHHALTEGDSVNTELLYVYKEYTSSELAALVRFEAQTKTPVLPTAIAREFYFPYQQGRAFVQTLFRREGQKGIDAAYRHLPQSTYEIMHPYAYLKRWKPSAVTLHGIIGFPDWKQVDDDVFGAFGFNVLLRQYGSGRKADAVTDSYRGDRYLFLESGAGNTLISRSAWTSNATARAARDALLAGLKSRYHTVQVSRQAPTTTLRYKGGAVAFSVVKNRLLTVYAPTAVLARQFILAPYT